jgi:hypothetical protein
MIPRASTTIRKTRAAGPTATQERTENIRERRQQKDPRTGGNTSRRDVNKVGILEIAGTPTTADTTTTAGTQRSSMAAITSPTAESSATAEAEGSRRDNNNSR